MTASTLDAIEQLRNRSIRFWLRAAAFTLIAGAAIALPARLIPNDLFKRMTPTRPMDYVFWLAGSVLIGLLLALPRTKGNERNGLIGGVATGLAVGCPVCNKLVVALIGVAGALDVFAPFQTILGFAAMALMLWTLRRALLPASCELDIQEPSP